MLAKSQETCWVVTEGKAGMENQCIGLAEALGFSPIIKRIRLRLPWRQLSPFIRCGLNWAFSDEGDLIAPPWPDILIASGRAGATASIRVRRASGKSGRRAFTIQIQNPVIDPLMFDLLAVPKHDRLTAPNVISTRGSLHRITPELLEAEALKFKPLVSKLPRPLVAVIIGGSNSVYKLTPREMVPLTVKLAELAKSSGAGLLITTSRRTGDENLAILQVGLHDVPCFIWDGKGYNPYYGMLGLADSIIVTADSVNMTSEACSTGKPVHVIELMGGSDKFRCFHQTLRDDGLTRPFMGKLENWKYQPLNDTQLVADRVWEMMKQINN